MTDKPNPAEADQKKTEESAHDEEKVENEAAEDAQSEPEKTDKDQPKKEEPHPDTIKYAELLKKQLGKRFNTDWDKLPIGKRIEKMETIIEFLETEKANEPEKRKSTEGKIPNGKPAPNPDQEMDTGRFPNYAAIAKKLNRSQ